MYCQFNQPVIQAELPLTSQLILKWVNRGGSMAVKQMLHSVVIAMVGGEGPGEGRALLEVEVVAEVVAEIVVEEVRVAWAE